MMVRYVMALGAGSSIAHSPWLAPDRAGVRSLRETVGSSRNPRKWNDAECLIRSS